MLTITTIISCQKHDETTAVPQENVTVIPDRYLAAHVITTGNGGSGLQIYNGSHNIS